MTRRKIYYVYIVASVSEVLYIGFTDCLFRRVSEHRRGLYDNAFSKKYKTCRLVYWEEFTLQQYAFERERQMKKYSRQKKVNLIQNKNPEWKDYYHYLVKLYKQGIIF